MDFNTCHNGFQDLNNAIFVQDNLENPVSAEIGSLCHTSG